MANNQKGITQVITIVLVLFGLVAGLYLVQHPQILKSRAEEILNKSNPTEQDESSLWQEKKITAKQNQPIKTSISHKSASKAKLPTTGIWQSWSLSFVPDSYFANNFPTEIRGIQSMSDNRLFLGTYNIIAVKDPSDTEWANLTYYTLPSQGVSAEYFIPTTNSPYEVYINGANFVARMKTDNTFELVTDPTDVSGYLQNIILIPYWQNNGIVGYKSNQLYYLQSGSLITWSTPVRCPNNPPIYPIADQILGMVTDVSTHKTFGIMKQYNCDNTYSTYLYGFAFNLNSSSSLKIKKLGSVQGAETLTIPLTKMVISNRKDVTNQKMLYAFRYPVSTLYVIPSFNEQGTTSMTLQSFPIDTIPVSKTDSIYDIAIDTQTGGSDNIWAVAPQVLGVFEGNNFDNNTTGYFNRTTDTSILANPYINKITVDLNHVAYTSHQNLDGQFNSGLVTVFSPLATYTISGEVFIDSNQNGLLDSGELGYPGGTIVLSGPAGGIKTTDSNGNYSFTNSPTGSYAVTFFLPGGYTATTPTKQDFSLSGNTTVNFGIVSSTSSATTRSKK